MHLPRLMAHRAFSPIPKVRDLAEVIYHHTSELPLVCPHTHIDPSLLLLNERLPDPATLLVTNDHYVHRLLRTQGLSINLLGFGPQSTPREIWKLLADNVHVFWGTTVGLWLSYQLEEVFKIRETLSSKTADCIFDQIEACLLAPDFRPRALLERFKVNTLSTTDSAEASLEVHSSLQELDWRVRIVPCFRPDALLKPKLPGWRERVNSLGEITSEPVDSCAGLVRALAVRRKEFKALGATATDHAVDHVCIGRLTQGEAEKFYCQALMGNLEDEKATLLEGHLLFEMALLSAEDELVMQLHVGARRNVNSRLFKSLGPDIGTDLPVATEMVAGLSPLLDVLGDHSKFRIVLFTLDPSTWGRELSTLAITWPAVRIGAPWWFFDSIEGMKHFRREVTPIAGYFNVAGFNDDSRTLTSIPARHDLSRRVDANHQAEQIVEGTLDMDSALEVACALAVDIACETYNFPMIEG